jgi:signal transduction histidine kinase
MAGKRIKKVEKSEAGAAREGQRVRTRFERLLGAGLAISSQHALAGVLQQVVDSAREVVGARFAALGVLNKSGDGLAEFVTSGLSASERERIGELPRGRGLLGLLIREPRPLRSSDINRHPKRFGFPPSHPPMKSFLGVPVVGRGLVFGNLYLTEKTGADEFDAEDEAIAVSLAAQAAVAVENARLYEETKALLTQVQTMQRQRDLFFAMMNHELRNALTGVYGWAERLVRGRDGAPVSQAAREVYEAADRTITLLNNFLDLTRLDAGKVRPVWRDVSLRSAFERVLAGAEPGAAQKHITLDLQLPAEVPALRTDPVRLDQIITNLVSNALRHSPEGATITIQVEGRAAGVQVQVIDRGPGVPVELRERIFEPFERFDPHSGLGTGLGLPVSRRLAEVLGGTLEVGDTLGGGATFTLELPASPPQS